MCGIFGVIGQKLEDRIVDKVSLLLKHRGPDAEGVWTNGYATVLHRRLSVIDLTNNGAQPRVSLCGRYILSYNGEIYNFRELRRELERLQVTFRGDSDTEVLLNACIAWGIEAATKKLDGMFSFALYDQVDKVLWLARDPLGIKPLYYSHHGDKIAFCSVLTPLTLLSWVGDSINQEGLFEYFRFGYIPAPLSVISGVSKLSSGSILRFSKGVCSISKFYSIETKAKQSKNFCLKDITEIEATKRLDSLLVSSVRMQMQSDVPYGAFLSGGIDSSLIVSIMQSLSSRPIKTYTIGFVEDTHDESRYAKQIAKYLQTDHNELLIGSEDVINAISDVSLYFDEPFADSSAVPTYIVSKFASHSVKVCLSGDGGDELFGGYPRYFWANRIERFRQSPPMLKALIVSILRRLPENFWNKFLDPITGRRYSNPEGLSYRVQRLLDYCVGNRSNAYIDTMSIWHNPSNLFPFPQQDSSSLDLVAYPELTWAEEMMLIDMEKYLQDDILVKLDRASMAASLESRVPLLTKDIFEFAWQVPSSIKLSGTGDRGKLILRNVLAKYIPTHLFERPKQGFGMPVGQWLRGPLRQWAESLLETKKLEDCGLNAPFIREIWKEHLAGENRRSMLWSVLMYCQWLQKRSSI